MRDMAYILPTRANFGVSIVYMYSALPISRGHFSPNNSGQSIVSSKSDYESFTIEVIVEGAISCYIAPRYMESL